MLAKDSVSVILGQPVHYAMSLDFASFVRIIDALGGLEVEVERSFDDYKYPIPGRENDQCLGEPSTKTAEFNCRYEHIHFNGGQNLMDGATALKFVRSRNGEGEEGTDFARSARQQKVINSIKQRLLSAEFIVKPWKFGEIC